MSLRFSVIGAPAVAVALAFLPCTATADAVGDFYKGKQIRLIIGTGVGGSYDVNGRLLARHITRHIPGKPSLIVQNMPGAGSRKAAGYVYKAAAQDGSVLAQVLNTLPLLQALGAAGKGFDAAKFHWIGNLSDDVSLVDVWNTVPVKTIDDARKTQVILGATSPGSLGGIIPTVLNKVVGTKFKIVTGYKSGTAIDLAVERGEVQGRAGASWTVLAKSYPHLIKEGKLVHLAQMGMKRAPGLEQVPLMSELGRNDEEKKLLEIFSSPAAVGKPTVVGPGVPAERVAALRTAYDATMRDPRFLADASKQGLAIGPVSGTALQQIVVRTVNAPAALREKARNVVIDLGLGKKKAKKKKS